MWDDEGQGLVCAMTLNTMAVVVWRTDDSKRVVRAWPEKENKEKGRGRVDRLMGKTNKK